MRLLGLAVLLAAVAAGAEICPPEPASTVSGAAGLLRWSSFKGEPRPAKYCTGAEVRIDSPAAAELSWPDAAIERARVSGWLRVTQCCFDGIARRKSTLRWGTKNFAAGVWSAAEEGLANHEEGYPDLIEEDARVRQMSISGSLAAGGKEVHLDIVLKCTASQFGGQYAYQYVITNRSTPQVEVAWSSLMEMKKKVKPSIQETAIATTYIFVDRPSPAEGEGRVALSTATGILLSTVRMPDYQINFR